MLVPQAQVQAACTLSIEDVRQAMKRGGYTIERNELTGVDFMGMSEQGSFVYSVSGPDPEGGDDITLGNVYLRFKRKTFSNEFELHGDY
jgi:hypothetical protein